MLPKKEFWCIMGTKNETPIKENEVTTYQDFYDKSVVGDKLEVHEVLQNAWLKFKRAIKKQGLLKMFQKRTQ